MHFGRLSVSRPKNVKLLGLAAACVVASSSSADEPKSSKSSGERCPRQFVAPALCCSHVEIASGDQGATSAGTTVSARDVTNILVACSSYIYIHICV